MRLGTKRGNASQRVTSSSAARQRRLGTRLAPGVSVQSRLSSFETDGILGFGRRLCCVFETVFALFEYLFLYFVFFVGFSFILTSALGNPIRYHE